MNWQQLLQGLLGPGLIAAGGALQDDPLVNQGMRTEATQYLRNMFTSPTAYTGALGTNVTGTQQALAPITAPGPAQQYLTGLFQQPANPFAAGGLYEQYLPTIEQQKTSLLNDVQQRAIAGQPASFSAAMSGPELALIQQATSQQIAPSYQKLFADLTRENQLRQQEAANRVFSNEADVRDLVARLASGGVDTGFNAATNLLRLSQPDPFADALAKLGTMLTLGGGLGGGGAAGGGGSLGGLLGSLFGGGGGTGGAGGGDLIGSLLGALGGAGGQLGGTLQQLLSGALSGQGISPANLSSLSGLLSSLASGGAGLGIGNAIGSNLTPGQGIGWLPTNATWEAGLGGAGGGALAGLAIGGPFGALLGALTGGAGGLFSQHKASTEQKALFRTEDLDSQRDQVYEIGNVGGQFLQQLGASPQAVSDFTSYVNQLAATSESPADEQGMVASRLNQLLTPLAQARGYATLDQVPGLRTTFIDYLTRSTFSASNGSYGGGAPLNFIQSWAGMTGLQEGGILPFGGTAVVGERGPELLQAGPGSRVLPMTPGTDGAYQLARAPSQLPFLVPQGAGMQPFGQSMAPWMRAYGY